VNLEQSLFALGGAASLSILDRDSGSFKVAPKDAPSIVTGVEKKHVALEIVFRVEGEHDGLSACFSYPKSEAWALRIEPLTMALIDNSLQRRVAAITTEDMERLRAWLTPGEASMQVGVHDVEGPLDPEVLTTAINGKKRALEACLGPVMKSRSDTAVLGFAAVATPGGSLVELRREVEAIDQAGAASCVEKVLASLGVPKRPKVSRVHIAITVERESPEPRDED
jgi:hypothetical protein